MTDYEKIKCMAQRKSACIPRFQDDSNDIREALTRDMSETIAFLESYNVAEINLLSVELCGVSWKKTDFSHLVPI